MKRIEFVLMTALLLLWPGVIGAQQRLGQIKGRVADTAGNPVPNLTLVVRSIANGTERQVTTDQDGAFTVAQLEPGKYSLQVQKAQAPPPNNTTTVVTTQCTSHEAVVKQDTTTDLKLHQCDNGDVEVQVETVAVDRWTSPIFTTFNPLQIELLPEPNAIGRRGDFFGAYNLSLFSEAVTPGFFLQEGIGPAVGGRPNTSNNFHVEGIDNNNHVVPGPSVTVSNEATTDFALLQDQRYPSMGQVTGGKLNLFVNQGSNQWHGGVYDYLNNRKLNAGEPSLGNDRRDFRYDQNRIGGKIGGPIVRDRLLTFINFEYIPLGVENTNFNTVLAPTAAGFRQLASINGVSLNNLNQLRRNVEVSDIPVTTTFVNGQVIPLGLVNTNLRVSQNAFRGIANFDWNIGSRSSVAFRYGQNDVGTDGFGSTLEAFRVPGHLRSLLGGVHYTTIVKTGVTAQLTAGYNRFDESVGGGSFIFPGLTAFPNINIQGLGLTLGSNVPVGDSRANTYQLNGSVDWLMTGHHLTFGADARQLRSVIGNFSSAPGNLAYTSLERYVLDLTPDVLAQRSFGGTSFNGKQNLFYTFVQDSIRLFGANIELGLGYQYAQLPESLRDQGSLSTFNVPGLISFDKPKMVNTNFAPRLGFAWSPASSQTVIRGSFGMMYDAFFLNRLPVFPGMTITTLTNSASNTQGFLASGGVPAPRTAAGGVGTFVVEQHLPYTMNWTAAVSRGFFGKLVADIRYIGNHGVHMPLESMLNDSRVNAFASLPVFFANPGQGTLDQLTVTQQNLSTRTDAFNKAGFTNPLLTIGPDGTSWYNAFALNLTQTFAAGTQVTANYTWSDTRADATGTPLDLAFGRRMEQAPWSQKNRATITSIFDLASMLGRGSGLMHNIFANFSAMGTLVYGTWPRVPLFSGVDTGFNGNSLGSGVFVNPVGIPGLGTSAVPLKNSSGATVAFLASDPRAQFVTGGPGTFSTERPTLRLGETRNVDLALVKRFSIPDNAKIEVRADGYNIFNRAQFTGLPPATLGPGIGLGINPSFLLASGPEFNNIRSSFSTNPRTIQLALRVLF